MSVQGFICMPRIFKFKGFTFEFHTYCGPVKLNKDLDPSKRQGRTFYKAISEFCKLSTKKQHEYLYIDGGCHQIGGN